MLKTNRASQSKILWSCFQCLFLLFVLFLGIMVVMPTAYAQQKQKKGPKKTNINFEDELVEGGTQKPELFYLLQKKQFNYKRLIKLRENFIPEMESTSEAVQRRGSGD